MVVLPHLLPPVAPHAAAAPSPASAAPRVLQAAAPSRRLRMAAASSAPGAATTAAATAGGAQAPPPPLLSQQEGVDLMQRIQTLVLDCDGVLWRGNQLLPNTVEALAAFRAAGKRLLFVTNNASKSRRQYVSKFAGLGIDVAPEEIVSSSYAAAAYLAEMAAAAGSSSSSSSSSGKKVFTIGTDGLREELELAGLRTLTYDDTGLPTPWPLEDFATHSLDPDISAVVVGWDGGFHYGQLCLASAYLRETPGCEFVATNPDSGDKLGDNGRLMPGTGCLVEAVATVVGTKPVVVGKGGGDWLLKHLQRLYDLDPQRTAVVGDRLDTDVAMGRAGGMVSVLTLTGVATAGDAAAAALHERPDYVVAALPTLAGL